jgi:hypothetical protein
MTKITYRSKNKLHTSQLIFIRQEGLDIRTIGIASVITARKISVQEALKKLKAAVTDWVKNTQSGRACYEYAGGKVDEGLFYGTDLNIGDLATNEEQFTSDGQDYLRKHGILDFSIQYVGDLSEGTFSYDHVLVN